ncbi:hypothetical protein [Motilimonas eburnea]|uniref:hypothetical protein n=1 Tax=Motilimonas eburnea TaxID=1737488 RepID=UPI001E442365|nr:hypothetical protein [Motilimonas eburnea]MCE2571687.1 hypothetical protein [Motilimonas eburnea]
MKLTILDGYVISEYIRFARPDYKGPIHIDLKRLADIHKPKVEKVVEAALIKMRASVKTTNR